MVSAPYDISPVLGDKLVSNSSLGNGTIFVDYSAVTSNALYVSVNVSNINTTTISGAATLNFTFSSPVSNEYLQGGFFFGGDNPFFINRGGVKGFDNVFFTDKFSAANPISEEGTWSMVGVIDRSIFEVFLDQGTRSATTTFYPTQPLTQLMLTVANILPEMTVSVAVYAIESAWALYENEQGTVVGNITSNSTVKEKRHMVYEADLY